MNFFKLYMGDYQRDTGALSIAEHGAYFLMLQYHYATEKPLPTGKDLYRLLRCESKADRCAVDAVARQFWTEADGGLVNNRAQEEIAGTHAYAEAQSQRANKRWNKPVDMPVHMPTHVQVQSPIDASHSHSHSQITTKSKTLSGKPDAVEVLKFLNLKANRNYRDVKANTEMIQARLAEGFTVAELKQVVAKKCREWINDDKMSEFIRPKTLFSRTNFANYAGELVDAAESS